LHFIVDEFFPEWHRLVTSIVRSDDDRIDSTIPFGGLSVILCGDFGQFPPVGQNRKALYSKQASNARTEIGRHLYSQFITVIKLDQQMRVIDQGWLEILQRTRQGLCTKDDIAEIRRLVLTEPSCNIPDFSSYPWKDAVLITPRNSVRSRWNKLSVIKHCTYSHNVLYVVPPEESVGEEPSSMQQRLVTAQMPMDQTERLPAYVYFAGARTQSHGNMQYSYRCKSR
jgi:hypothetical protein